MSKTFSSMAIIAVAAVACGGDPPVQLEIETPSAIIRNQVVLHGTSYVPAGSICPNPGDYVRIGTLGPHAIAYANAATSVTGQVFSDLWVCNADDGRTMRWTSNPITLVPGPNVITVMMTTPGRSSQAHITLQGGS